MPLEPLGRSGTPGGSRRARSRRPRLLVARPPEGAPGLGAGRTAYPVLAFGHGFVQRPWRYRGLLEALASRGFLVVAPDTRTGPLPSHRGLADDLWQAVEAIRAAEPIADPDLAVAVGHSMGAGCALLAATRAPGFAAVATMSALDTRPSMRPALGSLAIPTLFVVGAADSVVPPERTREVYAATAGSPVWVEIPGGGHCGFLDRSFPRGAACGDQRLDPAQQRTLAAELIADWLDSTVARGRVKP